MALPTCYTPRLVSLSDKLVDDNFVDILVVVLLKRNHLIARRRNDFVQSLCPYGRTAAVDEVFTAPVGENQLGAGDDGQKDADRQHDAGLARREEAPDFVGQFLHSVYLTFLYFCRKK
jgi:hypothetical protein